MAGSNGGTGTAPGEQASERAADSTGGGVVVHQGGKQARYASFQAWLDSLAETSGQHISKAVFDKMVSLLKGERLGSKAEEKRI